MYNLKKNVHQQYELFRWQSFGSGALAWQTLGSHGGAAQHSLGLCRVGTAGAPPLAAALWGMQVGRILPPEDKFGQDSWGECCCSQDNYHQPHRGVRNLCSAAPQRGVAKPNPAASAQQKPPEINNIPLTAFIFFLPNGFTVCCAI